LAHFTAALAAPANLGEARHLLANSSNIHFWLGEALAALGRRGEARAAWRRSADFRGDFQEMTVRPYSEMTYYSACALVRLGRRAAARKVFGELEDYAKRLARTPANVDYFATSLPTMLLFEDQLQERQERTAMFLRAQALVGLGRRAQAKILLRRVLEQDPGHAGALDLLAEMDVSRS
jgi:tetratricopeptide (TPR) repeat protein